MSIARDDIVRVTGKPGDYRVLHTGLSLGAHVPIVYLEACQDRWVNHLTVPVSSVYRAPEIGPDPCANCNR